MRVMNLLLGSLFVFLLLAGVACDALDADERGGANPAQLSREAKVTPDQARPAALAAVPGTVQGMRLERAGGKVIYDVDVQPSNGGKPAEVKVDAITGKVLPDEATGTPGADAGD